MVLVEIEPAGLDCPAFADELVRCEALQGFESAAEIVGSDEVLQMHFELPVAVVVVAFDSCFLDGAVHTFDLAVGP